MEESKLRYFKNSKSLGGLYEVFSLNYLKKLKKAPPTSSVYKILMNEKNFHLPPVISFPLI
jgi:hypothetical protein